MPTNKLWIEHTERAAWEFGGSFARAFVKSRRPLAGMAGGVERVPQAARPADEAKQKYAPDASGYDEIVAQLLARIERLQSELDAAKTPGADGRQLRGAGTATATRFRRSR